jgi:hypothetical protein
LAQIKIPISYCLRVVHITYPYFGTNYNCISNILVEITHVVYFLGQFWCKLTTAKKKNPVHVHNTLVSFFHGRISRGMPVCSSRKFVRCMYARAIVLHNNVQDIAIDKDELHNYGGLTVAARPFVVGRGHRVGPGVARDISSFLFLPRPHARSFPSPSSRAHFPPRVIIARRPPSLSNAHVSPAPDIIRTPYSRILFIPQRYPSSHFSHVCLR